MKTLSIGMEDAVNTRTERTLRHVNEEFVRQAAVGRQAGTES